MLKNNNLVLKSTSMDSCFCALFKYEKQKFKFRYTECCFKDGRIYPYFVKTGLNFVSCQKHIQGCP